jgi:predicted esterase
VPACEKDSADVERRSGSAPLASRIGTIFVAALSSDPPRRMGFGLPGRQRYAARVRMKLDGVGGLVLVFAVGVAGCADEPAGGDRPGLASPAPGPGAAGTAATPAPVLEPPAPTPVTPPSSEAPPTQLPLPASTEVTEGGTSDGPADAGAPAPETTHGSGGPVGPVETRSTGGLQYQINAPAEEGPHGLLVLLHGSTASNYENFLGLMQTVAAEYRLIPVSVLAPNGQGWNEGDQVRAAELLHALVQDDLYTQYDIDTSRVLFSGQSSGGGFLSSNFVPAHAQDYTGGAFFQCGAAPPNLPFAPDEPTRQSFRLHFEITTEDPIWPDSYAASLAAYRRAQMQLSEDSTKPGGHCQFDQQQVILDHIDFVLGG